MRRLYPAVTPFVQKLTRSNGILSSDVVQPAEVVSVTPPVIFDRSVDRISAAHPWSSLEAERKLLFLTQVTHQPVIRQTYGPGLLGPDGFASKWRRSKLGPHFTRNAFTKATSRVGTVIYANNAPIARYFGHWLTDGLPQTEFDGADRIYLSNPDGWYHCAEYRRALSLQLI